MAKKKGKTPRSFDAMVKFFLQYYNIPTRKDIDKLMTKLDRLEHLVKTLTISSKLNSRTRTKTSSNNVSSIKRAVTSSDVAFEVIKRFKNGVCFADVQVRTGFEEKKLRNIIYRLNKAGKITRVKQGVYIVP